MDQFREFVNNSSYSDADRSTILNAVSEFENQKKEEYSEKVLKNVLEVLDDNDKLDQIVSRVKENRGRR